jgi:hypothetical protein
MKRRKKAKQLFLPINVRAIIFLGALTKGEEKHKARQPKKDNSTKENRCPNLR